MVSVKKHCGYWEKCYMSLYFWSCALSCLWMKVNRMSGLTMWLYYKHLCCSINQFTVIYWNNTQGIVLKVLILFKNITKQYYNITMFCKRVHLTIYLNSNSVLGFGSMYVFMTIVFSLFLADFPTTTARMKQPLFHFNAFSIAVRHFTFP